MGESGNGVTSLQKLMSDSGYESSKSNSNTQSPRSSGSSKSLSSEGQEYSESPSSKGIPLDPASGPQHKDTHRRNNSQPQFPTSNQNNVLLTLGVDHIVTPRSAGVTGASLPCTKTEEWKISNWKQIVEKLKDETEASTSVEFIVVLTLEEGRVVYFDDSISKGLHSDQWFGKSFVDLVHPKDRISFAGHVADSRRPNSQPYFCRIQQSTESEPMVYVTFELNVTLKEVDLNDVHVNINAGQKTQDQLGNCQCHADSTLLLTYLIIAATAVKSAFTQPDERLESPANFTTRHLASCVFGHLDTEGIPYVGHLPQDVFGTSILDYYHPEDMHNLRDIYAEVMLQHGRPFRSKPYRFRVYNGTFAWMETDWSCFINPWSWKLEFVIGQHRVVKGPPIPNVFVPPNENGLEFSNETMENCKAVQNEIRTILSETISRRSSEWKRRKSLTTQWDSTQEPIGASDTKSQSDCSDTFSLLAKDTVMLGEISPYHDDDQSGSNESSETPPSYGQLNYRDNIERFFHSHPKTTHSNESAEKMETNRSSSDEDSKISPCPDYSSGSNYGNWSGSNESGDGDGAGDAYLTEELLSKHNQTMEKCLTQRHKEHRPKRQHHVKDPSTGQKERTKHATHVLVQHPTLKRGIHSAELGKASKRPHLDNRISAPLPFSCRPNPNHSGSPPANQKSAVVGQAQKVNQDVFNQSKDQSANDYAGQTHEPAILNDTMKSPLLVSPKRVRPIPGLDTAEMKNNKLKLCANFCLSKDENRSTDGSRSLTSQEPDESCSSSMASLLKTDTSATDDSAAHGICSCCTAHDHQLYSTGKTGPGQEASQELLLRFRLSGDEDVTQILAKDLKALGLFGKQSSIINEQLNRLYSELRTENRVPHPLLEDEGTTSSGNESVTSDVKFCKREAVRTQKEILKNVGKTVTPEEPLLDLEKIPASHRP